MTDRFLYLVYRATRTEPSGLQDNWVLLPATKLCRKPQAGPLPARHAKFRSLRWRQLVSTPNEHNRPSYISIHTTHTPHTPHIPHTHAHHTRAHYTRTHHTHAHTTHTTHTCTPHARTPHARTAHTRARHARAHHTHAHTTRTHTTHAHHTHAHTTHTDTRTPPAPWSPLFSSHQPESAFLNADFVLLPCFTNSNCFLLPLE